MRNPVDLSLRATLACLAAAAIGACAAPPAPCAPTLESAWIRAAPDGATMLAGYGVLHNACATPVTVVGAESTDFASLTLHETVEHDGMSHMRATGNVAVAPGKTLALAPGGAHLMLMEPARPLPAGASARITLVLADGRRVIADFPVRREAPTP